MTSALYAGDILSLLLNNRIFEAIKHDNYVRTIQIYKEANHLVGHPMCSSHLSESLSTIHCRRFDKLPFFAFCHLVFGFWLCDLFLHQEIQRIKVIQTDKVIHQTMVYHLVLSSIISKRKKRSRSTQSILGRKLYRLILPAHRLSATTHSRNEWRMTTRPSALLS